MTYIGSQGGTPRPQLQPHHPRYLTHLNDWGGTPQKTKMTAWKIAIFNRKYIGNTSTQMVDVPASHVSFRGGVRLENLKIQFNKRQSLNLSEIPPSIIKRK